MMARNLNQQGNPLAKARDKKQGNGFLCFSCLGKGRPPSSLIPDEISLILSINEKDKEHCTKHHPKPSEEHTLGGKQPERDGYERSKILGNDQENKDDVNVSNPVCPSPLVIGNVEHDSTISEKHGGSATPVTTTNTTSTSHFSLSQAPTNTISSQLSSHRFPSTGLSSPPPPLKCGFLVR